MSQLSEAEATAEMHVLVFGCPRRRRTYRALVPGPVPPLSSSPTVTIPCLCGEEHSVLDLYARAPGEDVEVVVRADPVDVIGSVEAASLPPSPGARQPQASDADLIDALPADPVPLAELAAQLGYSEPRQLARRVRSMNRRASRKGAPLPVAIAGGGKGHALTVARAR